jgi:hypothetical protein
MAISVPVAKRKQAVELTEAAVNILTKEGILDLLEYIEAGEVIYMNGFRKVKTARIRSLQGSGGPLRLYRLNCDASEDRGCGSTITD